MAINPNFVFSDPALQQQVVAMAQVRAAQEAARQQQFGETLRALRAERQVASDREERRAIREADIRRLDATEAERRRQFDIDTGLTREGIASREKIASGGTARREEDELYNNILNLIERSDGVPTASELEAQIIGLSAPRQKALRDRRTIRFNSLLRDFNLLTDEAGTLNALIGTKDPRTGLTLSATDALNRSIRKQHLRVNPAGVIEPLMRQPREDVAPALPGSAPRAENITDVLGRIAQGVAGNTAAGMVQMPERAGILDSMGRMGTGLAGAVGGLANRFFAPAAPAGQHILPQPQPERSVGFMDYLRQNVLPPVAERLNSMEIGPDLRGYFPRESNQIITSPALPFLPGTVRYLPDDFLAPPVFVPPY